MSWSYNPQYAVTYWVWAVSLSLATTQEITIVFSSSAYLDVSVQQVCAFMRPFFKRPGFPIRKSADQFIFADPRGLSQLITSFIASESQGIPRVPFLTFFYHCRLLPGTVCLFILVAVLSGSWFVVRVNPNYFPFTLNSQQPSYLLFSLYFTSSNMSKNVRFHLLRYLVIPV